MFLGGNPFLFWKSWFSKGIHRLTSYSSLGEAIVAALFGTLFGEDGVITQQTLPVSESGFELSFALNIDLGPLGVLLPAISVRGERELPWFLVINKTFGT